MLNPWECETSGGGDAKGEGIGGRGRGASHSQAPGWRNRRHRYFCCRAGEQGKRQGDASVPVPGQRKMRLAELREAAKAARFGSILPITGSDFVREVSQAPSDIWVVVFLFKDGIPECGLLQNCLEELATRYPGTKFVKIISTDCIPNYPDRNVPTILVYNNSAVKGTYIGLQKFGGKRCTPESVALALCQSDPVLNDGHGGSNSSRDNVIEGVRRKFIEKVVAQHEEREEEDSD
ncbi:hypothetical protein GQ55_9G530100 [Panicum hallii var. hallii]|uniref:Phosducin domain-containing protein n=1 Tax=Panicum hallii var. hallii TaxID=1504633 RepID=A0A2T7CEH9_9POAL|nr:hypothetical protein GQ55_9G530100 [Panicum hallii var. hallii]